MAFLTIASSASYAQKPSLLSLRSTCAAVKSLSRGGASCGSAHKCGLGCACGSFSPSSEALSSPKALFLGKNSLSSRRVVNGMFRKTGPSRVCEESRHGNFDQQIRMETVKVGEAFAPLEEMPEIQWTTGTVVENTEIADGLHQISYSLTVDKFNDGRNFLHSTPGQYVQIKVGDEKPGFFAIASPPFQMSTLDGDADGNCSFTWEFLVKRNDGLAGQLCDMKKGDEVDITNPRGNGFPIGKVAWIFKYKTVLLFATGSGIAPIRSLIEADGLGSMDLFMRQDVRLYYGCKTPAKMAYKDRFEAWTEAGVKKIVPVISQSEGVEWDGQTGYIQEAFKKDGVTNPAETCAVICGVKGMATDITQILTDMGVSKDAILFNF